MFTGQTIGEVGFGCDDFGGAFETAEVDAVVEESPQGKFARFGRAAIKSP